MSKSNSSKPAKPYPEYPLFAHASNRWCRKIRGRFHYFGPWDDPDGALEKWNEQKDDLLAGRTPRPDAEAVTVKELANAFLNEKQERVNQGTLSVSTMVDYKTAAAVTVETFGKRRLVSDLRPIDFSKLQARMAKKWGVHRLAKAIRCIRIMFKYAFESEFIPSAVRFGPAFKGPTKKDFRIHRAKQGPKEFTRDEILRMIEAAGPHLRAMILLGINCGFGPHDCAELPVSALEGDFINYPRPKTGISRRCALWPETTAAIAKVRGEKMVFTTVNGANRANSADNPITRETGKLLRKLKINGRKGLGFYTLRHVFRTVADESRDQPAVDFIMGHADSTMAGHYRERISDERLRAVADYVYKWLRPG